jgi:hypothetical protein
MKEMRDRNIDTTELNDTQNAPPSTATASVPTFVPSASRYVPTPPPPQAEPHTSAMDALLDEIMTGLSAEEHDAYLSRLQAGDGPTDDDLVDDLTLLETDILEPTPKRRKSSVYVLSEAEESDG